MSSSRTGRNGEDDSPTLNLQADGLANEMLGPARSGAGCERIVWPLRTNKASFGLREESRYFGDPV